MVKSDPKIINKALIYIIRFKSKSLIRSVDEVNREKQESRRGLHISPTSAFEFEIFKPFLCTLFVLKENNSLLFLDGEFNLISI